MANNYPYAGGADAAGQWSHNGNGGRLVVPPGMIVVAGTPISGAAASCALAGIANSRWVVTGLIASIAQGSGAAVAVDTIFYNGASEVFRVVHGLTATSGDKSLVTLLNLNIPCDLGASVGWQFSGGVAGAYQRVVLFGYSVNS